MRVRSINADDFPALAVFLAEDETRLFGRESRLGVPDVTAWLSSIDLTQDTWLFEEGDELVALASDAAAASGRSSSIAARSGFARSGWGESTL